jgi:hypothetical protein
MPTLQPAETLHYGQSVDPNPYDHDFVHHYILKETVEGIAVLITLIYEKEAGEVPEMWKSKYYSAIYILDDRQIAGGFEDICQQNNSLRN